MFDLYGSPLRITWGSGDSAVVLVDFEDDLTSIIELDGKTVVQSVQIIRAPSVTNFDRGNRSTTLRIAKVIPCATLQDALATSLAAAAAIPTGSADVLIEVQGVDATWTIRRAVIGPWESGIRPEADIMAIIGRKITGGAFIQNS